MRIYVGNLAYGVTDEDLEALFVAHGTVESAVVISDRDTGRSKGFGFVEMPTAFRGRNRYQEPQWQRATGPHPDGQRGSAADRERWWRRRSPRPLVEYGPGNSPANVDPLPKGCLR